MGNKAFVIPILFFLLCYTLMCLWSVYTIGSIELRKWKRRSKISFQNNINFTYESLGKNHFINELVTHVFIFICLKNDGRMYEFGTENFTLLDGKLLSL